jgi:tRNA threonylcarbamoyladenosine biosynthesis protein TsaB
LVVDVGPGSYTGLRVALAAAKMLGRFIPCPVTTVTSLEVLARSARERFPQLLPLGTQVVPCLDARRDRI